MPVAIRSWMIWKMPGRLMQWNDERRFHRSNDAGAAAGTKTKRVNHSMTLPGSLGQKPLRRTNGVINNHSVKFKPAELETSVVRCDHMNHKKQSSSVNTMNRERKKKKVNVSLCPHLH